MRNKEIGLSQNNWQIQLTFDIVATVECNDIRVVLIEITGTLTHIARITFATQIGHFARVHHEPDRAEHLETLDGAHASLSCQQTKIQILNVGLGDDTDTLTRFKKSALNVIRFDAIMTRCSKPIFRNAKSVITKLKISCLPYTELSMGDDEATSLNLSVKRIDTQAMRDPSFLYFSVSFNANSFNV